MKRFRILSCLALVLLLTLSMTASAVAAPQFVGDDDGSLSGEYDATVFLAGESPSSSADVKGLLFAAGNSVTSAGSGEYLFAAGNMVTVSGSIARDGFIAGNSISFTGSCARDLAIAGNALDIRGSVERDLAAYGRSVVLGGHIGGDVYLAAEEITVTDDAEIEGTLRYNSNAKISAPGEILSEAEPYESSSVSADSADSAVSEASSFSPLTRVKGKLFTFVGLLLIAYFLLWLTPLWETLDRNYAGRGFGAYAAAYGIGFAVLAGLPLACIILMITGVGLRPAFLLLLLYVAALIASPIFLAFFLGSLLWRKAFRQKNNYWLELAVGILCWTVLTALPAIPILLRLISVPLGLGVLARLLGRKKAVRSDVPALPDAATDPLN